MSLGATPLLWFIDKSCKSRIVWRLTTGACSRSLKFGDFFGDHTIVDCVAMRNGGLLFSFLALCFLFVGDLEEDLPLVNGLVYVCSLLILGGDSCST